MASISIFSGNEEVVNKLMNKNYFVHIIFEHEEIFKNAVENGFDREKWEKINTPNKVKINNH